MKMSTRRKISCLAIASLCLSACGSIPPPKGFACVAFPQKGHSLCYDMEKDFDENGDVKAGVKGQRRPLSLEALDKHVHFDPDSYASLKAFALKQKSRLEECEAEK